jgi:hypothetical protein
MAKKNTNPESAADRGKIIAADAEEPVRLARALTGRDIINALAGSPLADVPFERLSVKSKVRNGPKF